MNIQAAIFDLDGVLVVTQRYHLKAWRVLCAERSWEPAAGERSDWDTLEAILRKNGVAATEAEKQALLEEKQRKYEHFISAMETEDFYPGAIGFVIELRAHGVLTAIGTAAPAGRKVIESLDMGELFDAVVVGEEHDFELPTPALYERVARELGVEPEETVVFEDEHSAIQAARSAGAGTVGIGSPRELELADYVVNNYSDIELTRFLRTGQVA
ncbi:MAG: HAD family hydrolase [Spirochaetaceae bacterium]